MVSSNGFEFKAAPFGPEADPAFFVETENHRRALAHLRYGVKQAEGVVIITGDEGVGKSILLDKLLMETREGTRRLLRLSASEGHADRLDLLVDRTLKAEFGETNGDTIYDRLRTLRAEGIEVSLLVDDAHRLSDKGLDQVRRLANLFDDGEALLQLALLGRTPLRSVLYRSDMEGLRQRVIASYHLPPLSPHEVAHYVAERLEVVDSGIEEVISPAGVERLAQLSEGVPAKINSIMSRALRDTDGHQIDASGIDAAAEAREQELHSESAGVEVADSKPTESEAIDQGAPTGELEGDHAEDHELVAEQGRAAREPASTTSWRSSARVARPAGSIAEHARRRYPMSVSEINAAIEQITQPAPAPTQPRPRALSPQELMAKPRVMRASPPTESAAGSQATAPADRSAPVGDVWDDASPLSDEERALLDAAAFDVEGLGEADRSRALAAFLEETHDGLGRLKAVVATLKADVERLETRRRARREMVSERIDALRERLETFRRER
jgi:type II secretory pathway predicted ATPase ExeA